MTFDPFSVLATPAPIVRPFEQEAIKPFESPKDGVDAAWRAYEFHLDRTGDQREAMLCALERVRDDLEPTIRSPRRGAARISRKAKRRAVAALDRMIAEGREA